MKNKLISILTVLILSTTQLFAQPKPTEVESFISNPILMILGLIALILLFVIYILGKVTMMSIRKNTEEEKKKNNNGKIASAIGTIIFMLFSSVAFAQEEMAEVAKTTSGVTGSITKEALWAALIVIAAEVFIIAYLYSMIRKFSGIASKKSAIDWDKLWARMQKSTPIANEGDIDLGHNYDGIRELDNPTPPWWRIAFLASVLFAPIYLYRYHIAHSAPLQIEELEIAIAKGEARKKEFLATSANAIDENNIATMEGIDAGPGAAIFAKNCVACHGAAGEGNAVGPNLTDPNWIHGGGLTNIFKSVKYGWPEKGMKSWQAELSSLEMAQVSTYVASIQGSNPPNAKEPQGEVWVESGAAPAEASADTSLDTTASAE